MDLMDFVQIRSDVTNDPSMIGGMLGGISDDIGTTTTNSQSPSTGTNMNTLPVVWILGFIIVLVGIRIASRYAE